ncbi:hypothetical protein BT96DRAFT_1017246 [Gymnopus androsaceus JB14]|uniref:DUF6534 domain-containing protein n=1 Tax=Gymnopus androsaceus JB14 TaxID=1447944 RepID=A0A6A4I2J1_9AGAR|nr:hypothetical protein BT96DRAFT_1017246 [Gymnopus androsaceus JB14]
MTANTFKTTLGAIILGVPLAIMFSGALIVECIMYWRSVKPTDTWRMSCIVSSLLALDMFHSSVLMASSWKWFIIDQGMNKDFIPTPMALSILISGISILIVHSMYSWRIFQFSKHKYWLTVPIMVLAVLRFVLGCISSAHMIQLKSFEKFRYSHGSWVFGTGVGLTCVVDALITAVMMIILRRSRAQSISLDGVIDSLVLYTFETGLATVIATLAMLITWLAMRENLIFLALHFIIAKLYANSIVAMLNYRPSLRQRAGNTASRSIDAVDLDVLRLKRNASGQRRGRFNYFGNMRNPMHASSDDSVAAVEVNVTKTMQMHVDGNLIDTESAHSQY